MGAVLGRGNRAGADREVDRADRVGAKVRFAPSPTGALHIGGARTALFNWLLARHEGGELVLRIEDTDRERSTPENIEQILDALNWLELDWDEGPILQTERTARHQEVLAALLESGHAYRSQATAEDVKAYKERHGSDRGFRGEAEGQGAVRLRVPDQGATVVQDVVRGANRFEHVHMDDPVIARADGSVLYNFAVAIDDLDSRHHARGPRRGPRLQHAQAAARDRGRPGGRPDRCPARSTPTCPLLHGPDGKKLSKRHGAASVQELRDAGYLPEAVRNYLALLGWGAGDDSTVLSTQELIDRFTLERVSRNPARFDETKLNWLNGVYIRELDPAELARRLEAFTGRAGLGEAARISQEKIHTLADFWPLAGSLLDGPGDDPAARERWLDADGRAALADAREALAQAPELRRGLDRDRPARA